MKKNLFLAILLLVPMFVSLTLFSKDPPPPKEEKDEEHEYSDIELMGMLISDSPRFTTFSVSTMSLRSATPPPAAEVLAAISTKDIMLISNVSEVLNVTLENEAGAVVGTAVIDPYISTTEYINVEHLPAGSYAIYIEKADGGSGQLYGYFYKE